MKLKIFLIVILTCTLTGISFPQLRPSNFILKQNKLLSKANAISPINDNSINDIIVVGDTIWLATNSGVSLSQDKGVSWKNFNWNSNLGDVGTSAIGYYKGTFWAAASYDKNTSQGVVQTGAGLKYTTDNGKTWISLPQPVDADGDSSIVYGIDTLKALPVTVPEQNIIWDFAFTPGTVWIASFAAGLRRSTDMGKTWQRVVLPPDYLDSIQPTDTLNFCMSPISGNFCNNGSLNFEGFSVIAVNDSTLYVGTAGGINRTTDANSEYPSWQKFNHVNEINAISGNFVVALGYNKYDNTVWGATWQAEGSDEYNAVSYSSDNGKNWNTTLRDEKVHNFAIKDTEVVALSDDGPFATINNGNSWVLPSSVKDQNTDLTIPTKAYYAGAFDGNVLWLGTGDGLAKYQGNVNIHGLWTGKWNLYFASQQLSSVSDTYAYPNPFNPNTDVLKIKYSTGGQTLPVTIRILNFSMQIVRTIIQNADRGNPGHVIDEKGNVVDYWNGKDDAGNLVPNGVYFYRIDAGSQKPVYGKILVVH